MTTHGGADALRGGLRLLGELLVTAGLVVLLFAAYLLWGTNLKTAAAQDDLRAELRREWTTAPASPGSATQASRRTGSVDAGQPGDAGGAALRPATEPEVPAAEPVVAAAEPVVAGTERAAGTAERAAPAEPVPGEAVAIVRFPTLGDEQGHVVVEGVTTDALRRGPGHYPGTAQPGEVGNVVLSGHRTTYGAPFADVGELREGDAVVLETAAAVHTYRVTGSRVVPPTAIEVTYPVPGQAGAQPTERLLTLTTCHPRYSARQRLVVSGVLVETLPRTGPAGAA